MTVSVREEVVAYLKVARQWQALLASEGQSARVRALVLAWNEDTLDRLAELPIGDVAEQLSDDLAAGLLRLLREKAQCGRGATAQWLDSIFTSAPTTDTRLSASEQLAVAMREGSLLGLIWQVREQLWVATQRFLDDFQDSAAGPVFAPRYKRGVRLGAGWDRLASIAWPESWPFAVVGPASGAADGELVLSILPTPDQQVLCLVLDGGPALVPHGRVEQLVPAQGGMVDLDEVLQLLSTLTLAVR